MCQEAELVSEALQYQQMTLEPNMHYPDSHPMVYTSSWSENVSNDQPWYDHKNVDSSYSQMWIKGIIWFQVKFMEALLNRYDNESRRKISSTLLLPPNIVSSFTIIQMGKYFFKTIYQQTWDIP